MATQYCKWCTGVCSWDLTLRRMADQGFAPRTIIDVGACRGDWTHTCKLVFPDARVLMIEPLAAKRRSLAAIARTLPGVSFKPVLLGARPRTAVRFYEQDSLSSVFPFEGKGWRPSATLSMQTLDRTVARTPFARAGLVKIHVQGSELAVLEGAGRTLEAAECVFILVSLLELYQGSPLFHDVEQHMAARGFRVYDIVHFYHRELDGALAQIDVVFLKEDSPLLARKGW